ncbi:choice-of-anchor Q domain-containing protein [Marinicella meishanensis]|uniref:choice-of-anchor Q domain-containing protein n=1 Tax=Marinicella meishanensis TaxID=2873263 RepID=UPI001CBF299D|nr:choice-of-anchor Q domain-containing protein [Marinicella sp. NBU2979]
MNHLTPFTLILATGLVNVSPAMAGGGIPLTNDDLNIETAINSAGSVLDVLGNDDSGTGDNFKEVIAVCATGTPDAMCTNNSYSNATGAVNINGAGDDNNVSFTSNSNTAATFDFKYVMQNSAMNTGSAEVSAALNFIEVNALSDAGNQTCDGTECTLREAFSYAANDGQPTTVKFRRDLTGTITLTAPLEVTSIDLTVQGPGPGQIAVSGDDSHRVLLVPANSERFFLSGLSLTEGRTQGGQSGAGMLIDGATDTQIENVKISGNVSAASGGGLYVNNAGLSLTNSEISFNQAGLNGGGVGVAGGLGHDVTLENTTISHNLAGSQGDGIHINSNSGQNVLLRFVTAAFNGDQSEANRVGANGNIIIEASVFSPLLTVLNDNNIINNSIIEAYAGSDVLGDNNSLNVGGLLLSPLIEFNDAGVAVHSFGPDSLLYNHVDDMAGNAGCGTLVVTDQVGNNRPVAGDCDAGAYEYNLANDVIWAFDFD